MSRSTARTGLALRVRGWHLRPVGDLGAFGQDARRPPGRRHGDLQREIAPYFGHRDKAVRLLATLDVPMAKASVLHTTRASCLHPNQN